MVGWSAWRFERLLWSVYTMGELPNVVLMHEVSPAAKPSSTCVCISIVLWIYWIYYDLESSIVRDYSVTAV